MELFISLILTIICYFGIPFIILNIKKNKVSNKTLLWLIIANAAIFWFLFSIKSISSGGKASNGVPTFFWSSIAYYCLKITYVNNKESEIEQSSKSLPDKVIIGEDLLPKVVNAKYKWGNNFNAFIINNSKIYHKYNCSELIGKSGVCIHIYNTIGKYIPCPICKPRTEIDKWWHVYNGKLNKTKNTNKNTENNKTMQKPKIHKVICIFLMVMFLFTFSILGYTKYSEYKSIFYTEKAVEMMKNVKSCKIEIKNETAIVYVKSYVNKSISKSVVGNTVFKRNLKGVKYIEVVAN